MSCKTVHIIHIVIAAVILYSCFISTECGRIRRVVGGMEVACGTQPRVVSLRNASNDQHLCGATLLSANFALTAAHCVQHNASQYVLQLNNYCVGDTQDLLKAPVLKIIRHKLYDKQSRAHDIALLRVSLDMDDVTWLNDTVLPKSSFGISGECIIYGYGEKNILGRQLSESLSAAKVNIVSLDECSEKMGEFVAPAADNGMICAGGDGRDACEGDSGGPLICGDSIQGISSYGLGCGVPGVPGVYTSIGAHLKWLQTYIKT